MGLHVGVCDRCHSEGLLVNWRVKSRQHICGACWERFGLDSERSAAQRRAASSGPYHNDPGFDDVVRAAEEDR